MEIITIATQKGGTGKTTTAHALGIGLFLKGYRILFVDLDPQGNLSYSLRADQQKITSYEMLSGKAAAGKAVYKIVDKKVSIIPASPLLSDIDSKLKKSGDGKEYQLKKSLKPIRDEFDYIIIDSPPSLGTLTINALTASDSVIIPAQADIYSLQGMGQLYNTIRTVIQSSNSALAIKGVLLTRYNNRSILSRDLTDLIQKTALHLNTFVYETAISEGVAIKEAQASRQDIFSYAPRSKAAKDYQNFVEEFLNVKEC